MTDSLYVALHQIYNLVVSLNKKNFKASVSEINQLIECYKSDAEHHLFRILFSTIDFSAITDKPRDLFKCQLLINEFNSKISKPNFTSLICQAIDNPFQNQKPSTQLIPQIVKILKLNKVQEIILGLCLTKSNQNDLVISTIQWVKQKLPDLLRSYVDGDSGVKERVEFQNISMEILHLLLTHIIMDRHNFGIGEDQLWAFLETLRKDFPKESVPVVLSGLLYSEGDPSFEINAKETLTIKMDTNYLANLLEEMGSAASESMEEMKLALIDFDTKLIQPATVARCICMFMRTSDQLSPLQISLLSSSTVDGIKLQENKKNVWNLNNFFAVVFEKNPNINKRQVIEELDCKHFIVNSKAGLAVLQASMAKCVSPFPIDKFYATWKQPRAQFSFLQACLLSPDVVHLTSFPHKSCDISFNLKADEDNVDSDIGYWRNIDFIDALLRLSDVGLYQEVFEMLESPMTRFPHILFVSLKQSMHQNNLKSKILQKLFSFLINQKNIPIECFSSGSEKNGEFVNYFMNAVFDCYKDAENILKNLSCIIKLTDIINELKKLELLQPGLPFNIFKANSRYFRYEVIYFALDTVIYWTKRSFESFRVWVHDLLTKESNPGQNYKAIISYLQIRYPKLLHEPQDSKILIPPEILLDFPFLHEFLSYLDASGKILINTEPYVSQDVHCVGVMMSKLNMLLNPKMNMLGMADSQMRGNHGNIISPKNKLDPTKSAFVPQSKMSVRNDLPAYKMYASDSAGARPRIVQPGPSAGPMDISVAASDEKRMELELDARMKRLLEGEVAIEAMLEAYCNPAQNRRDLFNALVKVLTDELAYIHQYPEKQGRIYCELFVQVLTMENSLLTKQDLTRLYETLTTTNTNYTELKYTTNRELFNKIYTATHHQLKKIENPNNSTSLTTVIPPSSFTSIESPPEAVTERVYFIFNNVSKNNVQDKSSQLADVVTQDYMAWFAQYIVMKRVTTEANFHELFIQLIDNMADPLPVLKDKVLMETYRNIKVLLMNMKSDLSDFNDRQILKNLGKFLGMITLSKNKPILHDDINLKDLLYEAYAKGHIELHYVVPFVTKTLETAKDSIVFKPPCPWTMAILKVLKELHEIECVKLNLKFEVEILCRNLKIDFKSLPAAYFLKDRGLRIERTLCRQSNAGGGVAPNTDMMAVPLTAAPEASSSGVGGAMTLANRARAIQMEMAANSRPQQQHRPQTLEPTPDIGSKAIGANSYRPGLGISYQQAAISSMQQQQQTSVVQQSLAGSVRSQQPQDLQQQPSNQQQQYYQQQPGAMNMGQHSIGQTMLYNTTTIDPIHSLRNLSIHYDELNTHEIARYLSIEEIPTQILTQIPNLKSQLMNSMEKILHDLVSPLYERCAKVTISTVEQLVLKDFSSDVDISAIKPYAFGMLRNLTAGLCLVSAREIISVHLNTTVKQTILLEYRHVNNQDKEQVESFASRLVNSNNDICVSFLQKMVSERAIGELEKKLNAITFQDSQKRNPIKVSPQDLQVYENFQRTIPGFQAIQPTMSQQPQQQFNFPVQYAPVNYISQKNTFPFDNMSRMFHDIERHLQHIDKLCHNDAIIGKLRQIIDTSCLAFQNNDAPLIHRLTKDLVNSLMSMFHMQLFNDVATNANMEIIERIKEIHMYLIRTLQPFEEATGYVSICKLITNVWLSMDEPKTLHHNIPGKFNAEAFAELLKTHVISLLAVDNYLSKKILENNVPALMFTLDLLKFFVTGDKREFTVLNEFDLSASIDSMNKLMTSSNSQMKLSQEVIQMLIFHLGKLNQLLELGCLEKTQSCNFLYNGISLSREFDDPPAMAERTEIMIRMWIDHYCSSAQRNPSNIMTIITTMIQGQIIHNDECFVRFLRLATVYIVERAYNNLKQDSKYYGGKNMTYMEIDAYAMLVSCLINKSPLTKNEMAGKVCLLNKSLGIIAGTLLQEHEVRRESFHPLPFQRIFIMLFNELQTVIDEEQQHEYQQHVLTAFVHTFHVIRPKCVPAFVFSWLELISHRNVVSKILKNTNWEYTHSLYVQLLCDMYIFLRPFLENLHLARTVQLIYKGTVSLTCLLMHDFPEILINYHSLLCTILPINCIQLRNIILCTTTKKMQPLPDVLNNNYMDQLSQVEDPTGYCMSASDRIKPYNLRIELDSYLASRAPVKFLSELVNGIKKENDNSMPNLTIVQSPKDSQVSQLNDPSKIQDGGSGGGSRTCYLFKSNGIIHYDIDLMNNVIIYLCITAIKVLREKNIPLNINTIAHTAQMDIIQSLVLNLDNEGRFLLLNCMVNQLRFPNSHTYYFIFTILYLFSEQPQESVKEQITRVILERIIINRPHPWGLLFVMKELFKNKSYKFWEHKFLHCSDEIEKILQSVGQGFGSPVPPQIDDVAIAGITSES